MYGAAATDVEGQTSKAAESGVKRKLALFVTGIVVGIAVALVGVSSVSSLPTSTQVAQPTNLEVDPDVCHWCQICVACSGTDCPSRYPCTTTDCAGWETDGRCTTSTWSIFFEDDCELPCS